jgi:hypothetical protein
VVHLESGDQVVILEGTVQESTDKAVLTPMIDVYAAKYPPFRPDPDVEPKPYFFTLRPDRVFAWVEADFPKTATRWDFDKS